MAVDTTILRRPLATKTIYRVSDFRLVLTAYTMQWKNLELFPKDAQLSSKVLICHFDEESLRYGIGYCDEAYDHLALRLKFILTSPRSKKQLDFANKKEYSVYHCHRFRRNENWFTALQGHGYGEQEKLTIEQIIEKLK